jgi:hypothetical protein
MPMKRILLAAAAAVAAIAAPAMAGHVLPGLWETSIKSDMGQAMGNMQNMPPAVREKLKAKGIQMNGNGITTRYCVSPEQANKDKFDYGQHGDCKVENAHFAGNVFSADSICTHGQMTMRGHVQMTFESQRHYFGTVAVNGNAGNMPINSTTNIDAHFVAADCGAVKPRE